MGLLRKIKSVVIGNQNDTPREPKNEAPVKNEPVGNSIDNQSALMKAVEKTLKGYYKGQQHSFADKTLKIWVTDNLQYDSLSQTNFVSALISYLDNELGAIFSAVEMCQGPLPESHGFTKLNETVFLELCSIVKKSVGRNAEIISLPNYGSLKKERYVLDTLEIEKMPSKRYNIGIGEYPEVKGFRQNHIAVDDNPECPEFNRNRYVSRKHAYIRYSLDAGFLLQAEYEGTQKAGKRTRILRDEQIIEVDDIVAQPLRDGDCIELSKNVRFMFNTINE